MTNRDDSAPAGLARLFPHHRTADLDGTAHRPFLIGRLLEEGDSADLRWLAGCCPEGDLAEWVRRAGRRQLSRRSLSFWTALLDLDLEPADEDPRWPI